MANRVLVLVDGKPVTVEGSANGQILTWSEDNNEATFQAGGGGSGTVTSVGLTGGTSGLVIGGATSPITTSGTYNINAPQRFAFDTTSPIAPVAAGQISWNATEGSLNTLMLGGNVDAVVGQQLYQRAVNADTVTLTKGMVVYVFGSSGTRASVKRATADADLTSATILGVVAESIAQNAEGFIITNGLLKDLGVLPSTTFADGDVVYLSPTTPGGLTPTKPVAPQHLVMVGYCVKASNGAAGVLLVHPQNGYELGELHDVYINTPTSGQILIYDATSGQTRWENASLTGTANQVTVTPGAGSLTLSLPSTLVLPSGTTATTQAVDNNTTSVATTAYVVGQGYLKSATAASTYLALSGGTLTGKLTVPNTGGSTAGLNLGVGTPATASLVNGDIWVTSSNLQARVNGGTRTFPYTSGDNTFSNSSSTYCNGTATGTVNLATGPTVSGATKTVNIGTGGVNGSTTVVNIGIANDPLNSISCTINFNGYVNFTESIYLVDGSRAVTQGVNNDSTLVATTAFVASQGYLKSATAAATYLTTATASSTYAPLASPTFTGTVTLPLTTAGYVKTTSGGVTSSSATVAAADLSGTVALTNGGTNASLTAVAGGIAYSSASALALTAAGTSGQVLKSNGSSAPSWADLSALGIVSVSGTTNQVTASTVSGAVTLSLPSTLVLPSGTTATTQTASDNSTKVATTAYVDSKTTPYDISGEFVGTPVAFSVIMRFVAVRAFTLAGTAQFACATPPISTATFTVSVDGLLKGTVNILASAYSGTGSITSTSIGVGQVITVVVSTPADIVNPFWTLPGTV